ncbi:DUF2637 domain-containing protein, partial [Streptomyces sp. NPDC003299]
APVESLMPLRLARYGVPLSETAPAGLAAAGIEPALIPSVAAGSPAAGAARVGVGGTSQAVQALGEAPHSEQRPELVSSNAGQLANRPEPQPQPQPEPAPEPDQSPWFTPPQDVEYHGGYDPTYDPDEYARWIAEQQQAEQYEDQYQEEPPLEEPSPEETGSFPIPVGPNRTRELGDGGGTPDPEPTEEDFYLVFRKSIDGSYPTAAQFREDVEATFGITLSKRDAERMVNRFSNRYTAELQDDHIA